MYSNQIRNALLRGDNTTALDIIQQHINQREILDQQIDPRVHVLIVQQRDLIHLLTGRIAELEKKIELLTAAGSATSKKTKTEEPKEAPTPPESK